MFQRIRSLYNCPRCSVLTVGSAGECHRCYSEHEFSQINSVRWCQANCQRKKKIKLKNALHWNKIFVVLVVTFMFQQCLRRPLSLAVAEKKKKIFSSLSFQVTDIVRPAQQLRLLSLTFGWREISPDVYLAWNAMQSSIRDLPRKTLAKRRPTFLARVLFLFCKTFTKPDALSLGGWAVLLKPTVYHCSIA